MKKCTLKNIPIFFVGALFAVTGILKLFIMGPTMFAEYLQTMLGFGSGVAIVSAWVIGIVELAGGLALMAGEKFPAKKTKKLLVSILILIITVAIVFVDIFGANFDIMNLMQNLLILAVLMSATGCCSDGPCKKKACGKCTDGTCTPEVHKD